MQIAEAKTQIFPNKLFFDKTPLKLKSLLLVFLKTTKKIEKRISGQT